MTADYWLSDWYRIHIEYVIGQYHSDYKWNQNNPDNKILSLAVQRRYLLTEIRSKSFAGE